MPLSRKTGERFFYGTSGLVLPVPNKQSFPKAFRLKSRLSYYGHLFNSIEINSSFYRIPMHATIARWREETPAGFKFTFKLYRAVTHNKLLYFDESLVTKFMQVINEAGDKKGCILIQFPAGTGIHLPQLSRLLSSISNNNEGWRLSVEFRNKTWYNAETYALLKSFTASMVIHDMPASATPPVKAWTNHVYLRYHGEKGDYKGDYPFSFLQTQASAIAGYLKQGKTVYAYFNNTIGNAVNNVSALNNAVKSFQAKKH